MSRLSKHRNGWLKPDHAALICLYTHVRAEDQPGALLRALGHLALGYRKQFKHLAQQLQLPICTDKNAARTIAQSFLCVPLKWIVHPVRVY